jgi:hypothetical protein
VHADIASHVEAILDDVLADVASDVHSPRAPGVHADIASHVEAILDDVLADVASDDQLSDAHAPVASDNASGASDEHAPQASNANIHEMHRFRSKKKASRYKHHI